MDAGDIALIHFPFSAREQQPFKKRPVLVVGSTPGLNAADQGTLVAMITSSAQRVANPGAYDIPLSMNVTSGLTAPSVCRTNRLWVAEADDFHRVIGAVSSHELAQIRSIIASIFGLG